MLRGSGTSWDIRKSAPYEVYKQIPFKVPRGLRGDCYDRYLVRVQELRSSSAIIAYSLNNITPGEVTSASVKLMPSKNAMKNSMESTIQHFKFMSSGLKLPTDSTYCATEAPKGEFGCQIVSTGKFYPDRVKLRAPGFFHLQGTKCMSYQHLLAYVVTIIGTMDIVFGEVDR